jgi:hypothetical protein
MTPPNFLLVIAVLCSFARCKLFILDFVVKNNSGEDQNTGEYYDININYVTLDMTVSIILLYFSFSHFIEYPILDFRLMYQAILDDFQ